MERYVYQQLRKRHISINKTTIKSKAYNQKSKLSDEVMYKKKHQLEIWVMKNMPTVSRLSENIFNLGIAGQL